MWRHSLLDSVARALATPGSRRQFLIAILSGLGVSGCSSLSRAFENGPDSNPGCVQVCAGDDMRACLHDCTGDNNSACQYTCTGRNATACRHDCAGSGSTSHCTQSCYSALPACPAGQTACVNTCSDLNSDARNCGICGNVCPTGAGCNAGICGSV